MSVVLEQSPPASNSGGINFDDFSLDELRNTVLTGELPVSTAPSESAIPEGAEDGVEPLPPSSTADAPPPPTEEVIAKPGEGKEEEAATEEEAAKTDDVEGDVEVFKFTENADAATFAKEKAAYLDTVEITPELQHILAEQDKQYKALEQQLAEVQPATADETAQEIMNAFDKMLTFRQTEEGKHVPDTTELIRMMEKNYTQETPQLVRDLVSMPSAKYMGQTRFQEFIRDGFGLDDQGMRNLEEFLDNGGRVVGPTIVPDGINPKYAEAFWMSQDREVLEDAVAAHQAVLQDEYATPEDKQRANDGLKVTLQGINQRLELMQRGLDYDKNQREAIAASERQRLEAINEEAEKSFIETSTQMLRSFGERIAKGLTMFEGAGANVTALAYTTLVQQALSDNEWSKWAQEDLEKHGVAFDWRKGKGVLSNLYDIEQRIAYQTATKANPRALELSRKAKTAALKELKALETDLMGRIAKVAINGMTQAVKKKVETAPKTTAVRPKAAGQTGRSTPSQGSLDGMSIEELRSYIGAERAKRMSQGLPV